MDFTSIACFKADHTEIVERICYCSRQDYKGESTVSEITKGLIELMLMYQNRYHDFLTFVRDPRNGCMGLTMPFSGEVEIIVYNPGDVLSRPSIISSIGN
jgi:hypothetical protein